MAQGRGGGRKPIATYLKIIRGNPGQRRLHVEPRPAQLASVPAAPAFLSSEAREEWARIGPELHRLGLLTIIDIATFAAYCQSYGRWVAAERALARMPDFSILTSNGNAIQHPLVGVARKAAADAVRYGSEFGLTPSSRVRLAASPLNPPPSKFDGLLGPTR